MISRGVQSANEEPTGLDWVTWLLLVLGLLGMAISSFLGWK